MTSCFSFMTWAKRRFQNVKRCFLPMPAVITLIWIFIASFILGIPYQVLDDRGIDKYSIWTFIIQNSCAAFFFCFYPLGGCLADIKFGRYKTVITSMHILLVIILVMILVTIPWMVLQYYWEVAKYVFILLTLTCCVWLIPILVFHANAIPFGMDQLQDSPSDHQSLFIHWYVFAWCSGLLCSEIVIILNHLHPNGIILYHYNNSGHYTYNILTYAIPSGSLILLLAASLWLANHKKQLFYIDSVRPSPYKLVYKVSKFAWQHKVPIRRSAFTYCEDEIPTGLDLCKTKYGGPFTTEQVEDVKAFYGILKVLFALGPVFFLYIAADRLLFNFYFLATNHEENKNNSGALRQKVLEIFLGEGVLTPTLAVIAIPLYIVFTYSFRFHHIFGMLKRIGLGILLVIATLVTILVMDTVFQIPKIDHTNCVLPFHLNKNISFEIDFNNTYIVIPRILNSLSSMFIYIALYEFICCQSPHNIKGMLIGLSFAIKGVFELLGIVAIVGFGEVVKPTHFPSCGMVYYIMNIVISIICFLIYFCVAKSYHYRLRDEPCHVYRYAEEYYSKIPDKTLHSVH